MSKKPMAFAGSWYPKTAAACRDSILGFLTEKKEFPDGHYIGGIVPHAGWYYSGAIACRVIAALTSDEDIDTVVLFGGHMLPRSEPFVLSHGTVETPFGELDVDRDFAEQICSAARIKKKTAQTFPDENTFELQNPFIKYFFPDAKIVMCAVSPNDSAAAIGNLVARTAVFMKRNIRIIGSTDMTHYGPGFGLITAGRGAAAVEWVKRENDRKAIDAMVRMDESQIIDRGLKDHSMCCPGAAAATVAASKACGAVKAVELDYATSYEKSASDSFVGYSGLLYACP